MSKKEELEAYYKDIKKERDRRVDNPNTIQNQKRLQKCNAQLFELKNRIREMEK